MPMRLHRSCKLWIGGWLAFFLMLAKYFTVSFNCHFERLLLTHTALSRDSTREGAAASFFVNCHFLRSCI